MRFDINNIKNDESWINTVMYDPFRKIKYIRLIPKLTKGQKRSNSIMKVRHYKYNKKGEIILDGNGYPKTVKEDYYYGGDPKGIPMTPDFLEMKIDTWFKFLEDNKLRPTFDTFVAHVQVLSPSHLKPILFEEDSVNPCVVDVICKAKLGMVRAWIENDILEDPAANRAVFRYKATMFKSEDIEIKKLEQEERIQDRAFELQKAKFDFQKKLVEDEGTKGNIKIHIGDAL